jgi:hypothetical protein
MYYTVDYQDRVGFKVVSTIRGKMSAESVAREHARIYRLVRIKGPGGPGKANEETVLQVWVNGQRFIRGKDFEGEWRSAVAASRMCPLCRGESL